MTNVSNVCRENKTESKRKISSLKSVVSACCSLETANELAKQPFDFLQRDIKWKVKKNPFRCGEGSCHQRAVAPRDVKRGKKKKAVPPGFCNGVLGYQGNVPWGTKSPGQPGLKDRPWEACKYPSRQVIQSVYLAIQNKPVHNFST